MIEPKRKDGAEGLDSLPALQAADPVASAPRSAGAMLRAAREKQGLHIAVLAATIKVSTGKLEALEQDRFADLPNATFARALAQSVCRSLKVDPRPILAQLPHAEAVPLEATVGRLNTPFQERASRDAAAYALTSKPLFWAGGLLLLAAVAVYWLPAAWLEDGSAAVVALPASAAASLGRVTMTAPPPASAVAAATVAADPRVPPADQAGVASAAAAASTPARVAVTPAPPAAVTPALPPAAASSAAPAAAPPRPGIAQLSASAESWVEVLDGGERVVLSRTLQAGETVAVDGALPLRVKIGNAAGTQLTFRGRPVDLTAHARDNVARVELR